MRAIAGVQSGEPAAERMEGKINGKVSERDLPTRRTQRPLVGKKDRSIRTYPR
jgi:hypothetical protein